MDAAAVCREPAHLFRFWSGHSGAAAQATWLA